jgi:hypothetical protein
MDAPSQATPSANGERAPHLYRRAPPVPQKGGAHLCLNPEFYSYRSATMGSTLVARRAGM